MKTLYLWDREKLNWVSYAYADIRELAVQFLDRNILVEEDCTVGEGCMIYDKVWVEKGSIIEEDCVIEKGCRIRGSKIGKRSTIEEESRIGKGCKIGENCIIEKECEIEDNVLIGNWCKIERKSRIGWGCEIKDEAWVGQNCELGNCVRMGEKSGILSGVKVGKSATIPERYIVNRSWLQIIGSEYVVTQVDPDFQDLQIGCEKYSLKKWERDLEKIARKFDKQELVPEYKLYIKLAKKLKLIETEEDKIEEKVTAIIKDLLMKTNKIKRR